MYAEHQMNNRTISQSKHRTSEQFGERPSKLVHRSLRNCGQKRTFGMLIDTEARLDYVIV
jgi:hypothetical protein